MIRCQVILRHLEPGTTFMLKRTRQRFTLLRKECKRNRYRYVVLRPDGEVGELHHSCFVKPILRSAP